MNSEPILPTHGPSAAPKTAARGAWRRHLGVAVAATGACLAPMAGHSEDLRLDKLEKENDDLRQRLAALEAVAQKEGILPSGAPTPKFVSAMSEITLSGFVQASYFYNTREPSDKASDGYLWNTIHDSFSINKVKLTLASKPAERSGEKWDAGFRASMIWGEDAPVLNTGGTRQGLEDLREAYIDLNVPLGEGLIIKAGQLISLLNFESGDGGAANPNFSQGYQWFFTGNGPSAGVQGDYQFTDWLNFKARVQNGLYAGAVDGNDAKTLMGSIGLTPTKDTWINLLGFGGEESPTLNLLGGSVLAGTKIAEKLNLGFEFDYFNFEPPAGDSADLWSVGTWIWYDFTDKFGIALRGEYLDDPDGGGLKGINLPGRPGSALLSSDADGNLSSLTLTFNFRPVPGLKIQPEVRYDHTSYAGAFDGKTDRWIIGAGASYAF